MTRSNKSISEQYAEWSRVFIVVEQYPHRDIACFRTLQDAENFLHLNITCFAHPIIVSFILPEGGVA